MKRIALLLALAVTAQAAPPDSFFRALHIVETSGRTGAILGDGGKALGPLQIRVLFGILAWLTFYPSLGLIAWGLYRRYQQKKLS